MTYPEIPWGVISAFAGVWMVAIASVSSWLLSTAAEGDDYDPYGGEDQVPVDDPRRDPDWCHAHHKPRSEEEG